MPTADRSPVSANSFVVRFAASVRDPEASQIAAAMEGGYAEVIMPDVIQRLEGATTVREFTPLVLKRAVTDNVAMDRWIRSPVPLECVVSVLAYGRPAAVWRATAVVPVRLTHTPLSALESALLLESLEARVKEFQRVELRAAEATSEEPALRIATAEVSDA